MKFSCDNCGAQYLIADTKLGDRGVKVRCKKCSYVIILRPEGFVAEPKNGATKANGHDAHAEAHETADAETRHSIPNDATLPGEIVAATSSELGLSQEFMALGFDDDNAPVAPSRNMSLSVGLDVAQIDGGLAESHSSPFSSERTGGSLDYVTDRPSAQPSVVPAKPYGDDSTEILPGGGGLGHAQTREITAEEEEVATRVEAREDLEDEPTLARDAPDAFGGVDGVAGFGDEATVGEHDAAADAFLPPPESPADEPPVPVAYGVSEEDARADSFDAALGSALEREEHPTDEGDLDSEGIGETMQGDAPKWAIDAVNDALGSDDDINDDAALAALGVPPDPAEGLGAEGGGLDDDFNADFDAGLSADEANQFSTAFGDDATAGLDDDDDDAAALAALGASSDVVDEDSADISGALSSMQVNELADMKSSIEGELAGLGSELSAFGADASDEDPKTAVGPAPEMDEAPAPEVSAAPEAQEEDGPLVDEGSVEDELGSAFAAMFDGDGPMAGGDDGMPDLASELAPSAGVPAETRVFDTDAMAQVQAEQEIAGRSQTREWYVAINDEQVGPLNLDELEAKWKTGEIDANTLSWRQGMADWTAIRFTEGLEPISALGAEKVPAVDEADAPEPSEMSQDGAPPQLAMEPEAPEEAPAASASAPEPEPEAEDDDSGWKPSAASALASLAAEELAAAPEPAPVSDVAVGPAIPAASTALEKLLEGENDGPGASMFGAAEKSESAVRPLPRRPDTVSSVPLRDPTIERSKKNYTIPAAILGGFLLLGVVLAGTIWMTSGSKPSEPVAAAPPPTDVAPPPTDVAPPPAPPPVVPAAGVAGATGPSGATGPTGPTGPSGGATEVAAVTPPPAPPPEVEEKKVDEEPPPPKKRRRRRRRKVDDAPPPPPPPREPPPPPPARRRTSSDDTADLLGAAPASRRRLPPPPPESDVPKQLDDSDVLGVLRKNAGAVRTCLKKQAAADPALDGTMTVKMVITRSGRTRRVSVSPDKFKSAVIGKCVSSSVKGWRFPKFSGPNMPIDFPVTVRGR